MNNEDIKTFAIAFGLGLLGGTAVLTGSSFVTGVVGYGIYKLFKK